MTKKILLVRIINIILTAMYCSCLLILTIPALAHHDGSPHVYSVSPPFFERGQTIFATVNGSDLNSCVVGIKGGGVFAFTTKQDPQGNYIVLNVSVQPDTPLGERTLLITNPINHLEASFPLQIIPTGVPVIESQSRSSALVGTTFSFRLTGMGLTNILDVNGIATSSSNLRINSFQTYLEGSVLDLSLTSDQYAIAGNHQIFINTIGGQAIANIELISNTSNTTDSDYTLSADPSSPGIIAVEISSSNKNQLILKGNMFDPDPYKNVVTLLENINGTVTSRQVEIISSNNGEIIVNLPDGINSDLISFAVSNIEGKSSNIKTVDLNSLSQNISSVTDEDVQTKNEETSSEPSQTINNTTIAISENNQPIINSKTENVQHEPQQEDKAIIQNLSQYILSNSNIEYKQEPSISLIDEIKDPLKLISSLEEKNQLKNQVDLIMLALTEAKDNQELSETLKKAENLKLKVEELEKLLNTEKQKQNPNSRKLAKYEQLLASTNAESRSQTFTLLNNLLKYKPQLKNLLSQRPLDLAAIQSNIPNDSIVLQYVPTEEGLIIFVVDNKNLKIRVNKNVSKDIINREVQAYRNLFEKEIEKINLTGRTTPIISWKNNKTNIYKKDILPLKEKSVFLYNSLIGPIEKDISNKKVIAIIANGWLGYLPFQSLAKISKDGDLSFLISDKSIVYLDSVVALAKNLSPKLLNMANITVFANPDGTLAGANKEAEIIKALYTKTTTGLVQKSFNIELINQLSKNADILHLATHGFLDGTDISSSYLVSGKKQIGKKIIQEKLYLQDIYDLNLKNSKLIVLSGCDTGKLGNLANEPDDIVGSLATAFRVAGANSILASLWKAHDEATKIIMQNFYENLKLGLDKAEALRKAELKLKANPKYGHPLFWSLFNLIGDWR